MPIRPRLPEHGVDSTVVGNPIRFIRWGDRGLAIVTGRYTADRNLYLLEGSFVDGLP